MSGGVRLGAFGWATQTVHGANRRSKRRPFVVVMENNGAFAVIFGRSEPRPDQRFELVSEQSAIGRRMGLTKPTHFQGEIALLPEDFEVRGFFVTQPSDHHDPDAVAEHELWLRIRALTAPRR